MTHPDLDPLALAHVLDARLHTTLEQPFHLPAARLYGLTVHDLDALACVVDRGGASPGDDAVRTTFLGQEPDPYLLLGGPLGLFVTSFDAAALVTAGWAAPLCPERDETGRLTTGVRPSRHPERVRIRIVVVVCDQGLGSVMRRADDPDAPFGMAERGEGELVDALEQLWFGDPLELVVNQVPARSDRIRRARHRRCPGSPA